MQRITGLDDAQVTAWEERLEAQVVASLQAVMDKLAARIERAHAQTAAARRPVLVAADGADLTPPEQTGQLAIPAPQPDPAVIPPSILPPGQPFISPDDLATIPPLWQQQVAEQVLPLVAQVFMSSAGHVRSQILDAVPSIGVLSVPALGSQAAEEYLRRARNSYDQIGDHLWATARAQLSEGFDAGESVPQLADRLRASAGLSARSSVLVARTSVIEASNFGSISMARVSGLEMQKEWIATPDLRTRPTHLAADGQRVDLNEPFIVGGFSADFPADPSLPPSERYRCFPSGTTVRAGRIIGAYRRWFDGELVEVVDSEGRKLAGTPNHPVLTDRGWVGLGDLSEADQLITYRSRVDMTPHGHDIDAAPTSIEQIFDSLAAARLSVRVGRLAVDFHGERPQGDVDVVTVHSELRNSVQTASDDLVENFLFPSPDEGSGSLSSGGNPSQRFVGSDQSATGSVRGGGQSATLGLWGIGHPSKHGGTSIPAGDALPLEPVLDGGSTSSEKEAKRLLGLAGQIAPHKIVGIRRFPWSGHVYNLETETGAYAASCMDIVVANCRCTQGYVMPDRPKELPSSTIDQRAIAPTAAEAAEGERFPKAPGEEPFGDAVPVFGDDARYVRPSLVRAGSPTELARVWQDEMRAITSRDIAVDAIPAGVSPLTAREYAEATLQMLERYPEALLSRIAWDNLPNEGYAWVYQFSHTMTFNEYWAGDAMRRKYLAQLKADVAKWDQGLTGWSVRGASTPQATVYHEFYHILDIETLGRSLDRRVLQHVERRAALEGITADDLIARDISAYAGSDLAELIAEAGTSVAINGRNASLLAREITEMVDAEYVARGYGIRTRGQSLEEMLGLAPGEELPPGIAFPKLPGAKAPAQMTVAELRAEAKRLGVEVPAKARKADLVRAVEDAQPRSAAPAVIPAVRAPAAPRLTAAQRRQALIDDRRKVTDALSDIDQLVANGASERALAARAQALRGPLGEGAAADELAPLLDAMAEGRGVRAAADALEDRAGLKLVGGRSGETVRYDPKTMDAGGAAITPGSPVTVSRAGFQVKVGRETITTTRASVLPASADEAAAFERKAVRAAARGRAAEIAQARGTAQLLADVDQLLARKAPTSAIRQALDPALLEPEQLYAGADRAVLDSLREALDTGDTAKLRSALTRAGTKTKVKPIGRAGAKATFDPATMEAVGDIDIPAGARVVVERRGATLPGLTDPLQRARVRLDAPALRFDAKAAKTFTPKPVVRKATIIEEPPGKITEITAPDGATMRFKGSWVRVEEPGQPGKFYGSALDEWQQMYAEVPGEPGSWLKVTPVKAYRYEGEPRLLRTKIDGDVERVAIVREGDYVVKQLGGEVQRLTPEQFDRLYAPAAPSAAVKGGAVITDAGYAERVSRIERVVAQVPTKPARQLGGGSTSDVTLTEYGDDKIVKKVYGRRAPGTKAAVAKEVDAEILAPRVIEAFDVPTWATTRGPGNEVIGEFIEGDTFAEVIGTRYWGDAAGMARASAPFTESAAGRRLGLADYVMGHTDRNEGNWIILPGDRGIAAIDNGYAFVAQRGTEVPPGFFTEYLMRGDTDPLDPYALKAVITEIDRADVAAIRGRLEALRPEFVAAGRKSWHDAMLRRLREVEKRIPQPVPLRPAGTRPVYFDAENSLLLESYADSLGLDLRRYVDPTRAQMVTHGEPVDRQRPFSHWVATVVDGLRSGKVNQAEAIRQLREIPRVVENQLKHARRAVERGYPTNYDRAIIRDAGLSDVATQLADALETLKIPKRRRLPTLSALTREEIPQVDEVRFAVPGADKLRGGPSPKGGLVLHRGQVVPESFEHPRSGFALLNDDASPPLRPGLTAEENHALDLYVSSAVADPLNGALRLGQTPPIVDLQVLGEQTATDLREVSRLLDSAIEASELSRDTTLWRGALMRPHDLRLLTPGAVITEPGYMSTAADQRLARNIIGWRKKNAPAYQKPVLLRILVQRGTHAAVGHEAAGEVLFGRGTRLQVLHSEIEEWSGTTIVTVLMLG